MRSKNLDIIPTQRSIRILTVADLDWRNGHEFALQALKLLKEHSFTFEYCLVGNGPFLEAVAFARHELGLETEVKLRLSASAKELDEYYAYADIFLLATVALGARHGLDQAYQQRVPIVCTDILAIDANWDGVTIIQCRNPLIISETLGHWFQKRFGNQ